MSDKPSPLGLFGKLPIEIRIPIWADVLSSRQPAVLRTSRAIYVEIAYLMYPALDYTLFPDYDSPWLRLHCPWTGTTFDISRRDGRRKRKKLWALSYNNTVLTIRIIAPDPTQRGEVVLLWQKTQDLVSILNRSKYYRAHIVIELQETDIEKNTWEENGSYTYINGYGRPNYFIIFLPFCRLVRARKIELVRVTPNGCKAQIDDRFLEYGCDFIINNGYKTRNTSVLRNDWKYRYIAPEFDNIDKILVDIDFFLENQLDDLPGHTAAMLRLDRFANWFPTKYPYESQYQRRYLLTVRKYPKTIKRHDTWLRHMRRRYRAFQYLYFHVTKNKNSNFVMCNPRAWYDKFPDGIYQLTRARVLEEWMWHRRYGKICDPPGYYAEFSRDIMSFAIVNTRKDTIMKRRRKYYLRQILGWCNDCRKVGFRTGCSWCEKYRKAFPYISYLKGRYQIAAPADIPLNRDIPKPVMDV